MADSTPPASGGPGGRRPLCGACVRPLTGCWCACVRAVHNTTPVLILQDPDEHRQAKGTAALLARCLSRVELRVGERFDPPASTSGLVLLYPQTAGDATLATPSRMPTPSDARAVGAPITLIVLDGTWRRSRRLLYENPWLQPLPRLALDAPPPSRYAIRRAQADSQRSTLEACALALAQLEGDDAAYAPLWEAMDEFIALQQGLAKRAPALGSSGSR